MKKQIENPKECDNDIEEIPSEKRVNIFENIHTRLPLSKVSRKYRKLKDHETRETLTSAIERNEPKAEELITRIKPERPYTKKKRIGEGYEKWLDKWPQKPNNIKYLIDGSLSKELSCVLMYLNC